MNKFSFCCIFTVIFLSLAGCGDASLYQETIQDPQESCTSENCKTPETDDPNSQNDPVNPDENPQNYPENNNDNENNSGNDDNGNNSGNDDNGNTSGNDDNGNNSGNDDNGNNSGNDDNGNASGNDDNGNNSGNDDNGNTEPSKPDFDWTKLKPYNGVPYLTFEQYTQTNAKATDRQGGCSFGKYFFQGYNHGNYISITDLETKKNIALMDTKLNSDKIHFNAIFFGNEYAEADDPFPLLYAASGYEYPVSSKKNTIFVFRIIPQNGTYAIQKVQEIGYMANPEKTPWVDAVSDNENGILYLKQDWNKFDYYPLPKLSEGNVTLSGSGHVQEDTSPQNACQQGMFFHNGKIYIAAGAPRSMREGANKTSEDGVFIYIYNPETAKFETTIDLIKYNYFNGHKDKNGDWERTNEGYYKAADDNDFEPESIFVWNDEFYIAYRYFIVKLEFDNE